MFCFIQPDVVPFLFHSDPGYRLVVLCQCAMRGTNGEIGMQCSPPRCLTLCERFMGFGKDPFFKKKEEKKKMTCKVILGP